MKKILVFPLCFLGLLVGYCALPLTSVSSVTIALEDQNGKKITGSALASFLDVDGRAIVDIALGELPSWDNNIHWWAHNSSEESKLRPEDARRARSVLVTAQDCAPLTLPIELHGQYVPPSVMPHGAGPAYMLYEFSGTARLNVP